MSKIITVFGATGNQGNSVIQQIISDSRLSKEFLVRGVTRDTSKPASKALEKQGVTLVKADLNSKANLKSAIEGSHTVFLATNYWEAADPQVELTQGKNVTEIAKEVGVSHMIFSSLYNVTEATEGRLKHVPHFDIKADIEKYIRASGFPFTTFVLPGYFMSNYTKVLQKQADGNYALAYPVGGAARFPLLAAAEDTGKFVKPALKRPQEFNGKQILAATDYYTVDRIVSEFQEVTGKNIQFAQVTPEQYKSFLPEAIGQEMLENHLFIESPGYYNGASLKESLGALEDAPTTWKEYVAKTAAFQ